MTEQTNNLGKLESVHPLSPAYLQRAAGVAVISFIFFVAMLIVFSIRQNIGYFLLSTAFLIVELFTLFGWLSQRKAQVKLFENGLTFKKFSCLWSEIKFVESDNQKTCTIIKNDGEKIVLPEAIHNMPGVISKIEKKRGVAENEKV